MRFLLLFLGILSLSNTLLAQHQPVPAQGVDYSASKIRRELELLPNTHRILYLAAHPDDENTRIIAWLRNKYGYDVAYLSLTRGEGGQNLIGTEQAEELGLLRTHELLQARRWDGGRQYFTSCFDFGFSKSVSEAMSKWDSIETLKEVVRVVRTFRPDVIITRFSIDSMDTHGHHTASARFALQAFNVAGNPNIFPEQLASVKPWQPKAIYWNTSPFFFKNFKESECLKVNVGEYDPLLGLTYTQLAARARSMHRCQGFGSDENRETQFEYLVPMGGDTSFRFTWGLQSSNNPQKVAALALQALKSYTDDNPSSTLPILLDLYKEVKALELKDPVWSFYRERVEKLIFACSGIYGEWNVAKSSAIAGESFNATLRLITRIEGVSVAYAGINGAAVGNCKLPGINLRKDFYTFDTTVLAVNSTASPSYPYFYKSWKVPFQLNEVDGNRDELRWHYPTAGYPTPYDPQNNPAIGLQLLMKWNGRDLPPFTFPLKYRFLDPSRGELFQPFEIIPSVQVTASKSQILVASKPERITWKVNSKVALERKVVGDANYLNEWTINWLSAPTDSIQVVEIRKKVENPTTDFYIGLAKNGQFCSKTGKLNYEHVPAQIFPEFCAVRVVAINAKVPTGKIGYLPGAGDEVAENLKAIGVNVEVLSWDGIEQVDLYQFRTIVLGVRTFNVRELTAAQRKQLLDYVQNGGTLLVQYYTANNIQTKNFFPGTFKESAKRVTDENATVKILQPENPIFTIPNKITSADFDGWVQERGIYFPSEVDGDWVKCLEMSDPGEGANQTSLIRKSVGKGSITYTGISFFRLIPTGVPGAYRLFLNLL